MSLEGGNGVDVPVLIVGAGPVGLGLAIDLGWRGVPCLIVEQGEGTFVFPRANAVNVRTMEICRRWGIAAEVRGVAISPNFPHTALYVTSLAGHEIGRVERAAHGGNQPSAFSPERPQRCNQMFFDPILRRRAESLPNVEIRNRTRFESLKQESNRVTATVSDIVTGNTHEISARHLIACCGGASTVRSKLGIRLEGLPEAGTPANIFFSTEALWERHAKGMAALHFLIGPNGRWATLISVDGRDLWSLSVDIPDRKGEISDTEARAYIDRALGMEVDYQIRSISYWVRREMVADRYGEERVLIAGDCAHLNGPEGGYGMNTGMGDAIDLGWKLWATEQGWAGPGLIASYETERRPIALRNVSEATRNLRAHEFDYPDILADTPEGAAQRIECGTRIAEDAQRRHGHDGLALGFRYASPLIPLSGERDPPSDDTSKYVPSTFPGCRAPHQWIAPDRSIIDLFGSGFTLLRLGVNPPDADDLLAAAKSRGVPVESVHVNDPAIRETYERDLVLVRPDGYVAWRGNQPPGDAYALIDAIRGA
jgi:2-polyprenyl-6-methoxyphenol hydroxylase-like FAD-dependent oxidoreductase